MKIIYMGTPDFAAGPLESIIRAGFEVVAVVTQPDKPKGRSGRLIPSPVKETALAHGIPVLTPARIRNPEAIEELRQYPADLGVVAAFGQILPGEVLNLPRLGCVNIHASLLPHLRGASPIQHAILNGDKMTGVTIMQMDEGLDTGDILIQESIPILDSDTGGSLFDKLSVLGSELIVKALPMIENGSLTPVAQDEAKADKVGMLKKEMGRIDFTRSSTELDRHVRGMDPWPGAFTQYNGKQLKIWKVRKADLETDEGEASSDVYGDGGALRAASGDTETADAPEHKSGIVPGTIVKTDRSSIYVSCGEGTLAIEELQLEGKKRMSAHDFMLGVRITPGECFGV
jgi:methionyl-tRNA formyltransferase